MHFALIGCSIEPNGDYKVCIVLVKSEASWSTQNW